MRRLLLTAATQVSLKKQTEEMGVSQALLAEIVARIHCCAARQDHPVRFRRHG